MITRSSMTSLTFLAFAFITSCGQAPVSTVASGSSVNNGPGPVGDILNCQGTTDSAVKFTIRHTAAITMKQGLLQIGNNFVSMKCDESSSRPAAGADRSVGLWTCVELRPGDGLFRVNVYTQGISALTMADLTIDQIFPLAPKKIDTLICHEPVQ